jgi:hypothetical protein
MDQLLDQFLFTYSPFIFCIPHLMPCNSFLFQVSEKVQYMCEHGITDANDVHFFTNKSGGAGGGGGASYVFKVSGQ